jgi:Transposase DDE domain
MAWGEGQTLGARFEAACELGRFWHRHWKLGESYGGFTAAMGRWTQELVPAVVRRFQRTIRELGGRHWMRCGWCALAVDGSRIEAPHTAANEQGLLCAGRDKTAPQVFLTTLWHMGWGLPWDFRLGPGTASEQRHLEQMLPAVPPGALLVADAAFVGYELCTRILQAGSSFLMRVGSNRELLTELGYHTEERQGVVYLWPQKFRHQPPLVLRLVHLQRGKQTIYLLTNVLDPAKLSDRQASTLYELRWGVEVFYRSYKQTLDRRVVKSRTPQAALAEVAATMLGLWLLGMLTVKRLARRGIDPLRWSVAKARNAVRRTMRAPLAGPRSHCPRSNNLDHVLGLAWRDCYPRRCAKAARNYPRKKRERPPGPPKIKKANPHQRRIAKRLKQKLANAA